MEDKDKIGILKVTSVACSCMCGSSIYYIFAKSSTMQVRVGATILAILSLAGCVASLIISGKKQKKLDNLMEKLADDYDEAYDDYDEKDI